MSEQKYMKIKKRFFYEGAQLALFLAESEGLGEYVEIAEFYGTLTNNAFEWFKNVKYPEIIEEYISCSDERKRFGGAVKYGYFMKVVASRESEKEISISCEVCMKNVRGEILIDFLDEETWDKELCIMVKKKKEKKKVRPALHKKDKSPTEL